MVKLQLLDLFSGIGGFSLGLESTGFFKTIAFVEKDKFCRQVLQKNFNNIPIEEDIRNVRGERYKADIITGGFPCQPFSVAGKRKGTDDDRYLWDETIRVVAECKPRWFIGENVEGIININNGMVLRQVQTDLEEQGFQVQCLVIPASGIGAWHQRKRIWIVAYSDSNRHSNKIRGSSTKEERISQEHRQDPTPPGNLAEQVQYGIATTNMFPTPTTRDYKDSTVSKSHQNRNSDSLPIKMMREAKPGGKLNPNFVEFLMGYPMNWTKIDQAE
jgi:DNA-cytosine methyltransferase